MPKYELLLNDTKTISGVALYRIRYIRDFADIRVGDLGGYIQKEENLSHNGDARVLGTACVFGNARVRDDASVSDNAWVFDNAWVCDDARVFGNAWVFGNARVFGNASVSGDARVLSYE